MQRYFVSDESVKDNRIYIGDNDFHHIRNVMRMELGQELIVTTYSGEIYQVKIMDFTKKEVVTEIVKDLDQPENTLNLCLVQALIKRDNFELVLQKATELGVKEIIPLMADHSIVKIDDTEKKKARYEMIVKEASEQSERTRMPRIGDPETVETLPFQAYDLVLIAYARHDVRDFRTIISAIDPSESVMILIGPEGGFSEREINFLKQKGQLVSLGDTILRSETAGIYAVAAFRFIWGE